MQVVLILIPTAIFIAGYWLLQKMVKENIEAAKEATHIYKRNNPFL